MLTEITIENKNLSLTKLENMKINVFISFIKENSYSILKLNEFS